MANGQIPATKRYNTPHLKDMVARSKQVRYCGAVIRACSRSENSCVTAAFFRSQTTGIARLQLRALGYDGSCDDRPSFLRAASDVIKVQSAMSDSDELPPYRSCR
jgi:hypothetical protein